MNRHEGFLSDQMSAEALAMIVRAGLIPLGPVEHPWFPDDMVIPGDHHRGKFH